MEISQDRIQGLKVRWDKARNFQTSFFSEFESARADFDGTDAEFARWCCLELNIGITQITLAAEIMSKIDKKNAQDALKEIRDAERAAKAAPAPAAQKPVTVEIRNESDAALLARIAELEAELAGIKAARALAGRKPIGDAPMTAAERMRRMRAARR
jgi:hypothetical protein